MGVLAVNAGVAMALHAAMVRPLYNDSIANNQPGRRPDVDQTHSLFYESRWTASFFVADASFELPHVQSIWRAGIAEGNDLPEKPALRLHGRI